MKTIPLPVPPLAEQQRIVDLIENLFAKLDEAKEKAQAVVDSFETRKAAILHKAFTGELTAKWREEHNISKTTWGEKKWGDFLQVYDLTGKMIIPFATSGGSDIGKTNERLAPSCKGAKLMDGKVFKGNVGHQELAAWVEGLEL